MNKNSTIEIPDESPVELPKELFESGEDYDPIEGISEIAGHAPKFVSEFQSPERFLIRFYKNKFTKALLTKVWFGSQCEGPPGTVHGGAVAAVLDEAMGQAAWIGGYPSLAAHISVNFRMRVAINKVATIEAAVTKTQDRKIYVDAKLWSYDHQIMADSSGLFIKMVPK